MHIRAMLSISFAAVSCLSLVAQAPKAEIKSGDMHATIFLPDAKMGFYHTTRFDWSGVIADLEVENHHIYKTWFNSVDPAVPDFTYDGDNIIVSPTTAMTGPAEEFQKPIGYDTAQPGETFLKIGVGLLRKADNDPYKFGKHFEIADSGTWTTKTSADSITFRQVLGDSKSKYGYVYTKTIRLNGKAGQMVIEHHLKNTGQTPLETPLYDHNFLTVDGTGVGTNYSVTVPYTIKPTGRPYNPKFVKIDGNKAEYVADLQGKDRVAFGLQGFSDAVKDYDFRVVNTKAQVEVRMQADRPLFDASVWSLRDVIAVEPFISVRADSGKEFSWTYTYTYTDLAKRR